MPKYLITATYEAEGVKGLLQGGGTSRIAFLQQVMESLGGTAEAFYFAFGEHDGYAIVDLPDNVSAAAIPLIVRASGVADMQVTPLLTPEEVDAATQKGVNYRPPGQ
jgi:uncharacterized protein with GYD domain